ncbi:MAG: hypothetical protein Q4A60_04210 [Pasteurellaceae bacterium]|nr:hypothetical protein [Pasteurellaceae bacterium]
MNSLTKLSTATLLALFLVGCDQASQPTTEKKDNAQQIVAKADIAQGKQDFQALLNWKVEQEKSFSIIYDELKQQIATDDKIQMVQAVVTFQEKAAHMVKEFEKLPIQTAEVDHLKRKAKENLELLNGLIVASVNAMLSPAPELQTIIQEQMQLLSQSTNELNQMQAELTNKFITQE